MPPERGRQQYQQGKDLQPAHEHGEAKSQLARFADSTIVFGHFAEPRPEIVHRGHHGGESGDKV